MSKLDDLFNKVDIADVISRYVTVTRKGNTYWACCPFHGEKTPSMSISKDKGVYHCFGCGKSGNAVSFISDYESIERSEAIKKLAKEYGVQLEEFKLTKEQEERKQEREKLYAVVSKAVEYYFSAWQKEESRPYIEYAKKRGLSGQTVKDFQIGCSYDFESAPKYLLEAGYDEETLIKAGLAGRNDKGALFDSFARRLLFPIYDIKGRAIGFSGRDITGKATAKYKNTSSTPIFYKKQILFGASLFQQNKVKEHLGFVLLIEGHLDVVTLHQYGIKNAVALMGTAFNEEHGKELRQMSSKIVLCLDGDGAGQAANIKVSAMLASKGFADVRVVDMVGLLGKDENGAAIKVDPDEFVRRRGKDAFLRLIDNAQSAPDYAVSVFERQHDLKTPVGRRNFVRDASAYFACLDAASREIYARIVAEKAKITTETVLKLIQERETHPETGDKLPYNNSEEPVSDEESNAFTAREAKSAQFLLSYILHNSLQDAVKEEALIDRFFSAAPYNTVWEYIKRLSAPPVESVYIEHLIGAVDQETADIIYNSYTNYTGNEIDYCKDCVFVLKLRAKTGLINELKEKLKAARDTEEKQAILSEIMKAQKS